MSRIITTDTGQLRLVLSEPGFWLPVDHSVRIFDELLEQERHSLPNFDAGKKTGKFGRPHYDHLILLKIVLYGYTVGLKSNRELAKACLERVDFRFLTGGLTPSFSTIRRFRVETADSLAGLFEWSLAIAVKHELVGLHDVAFDGTKILANASKHKAMSYERMCQKVQELHREIEGLKKEHRSASSSRRKEIKSELKFKRERITKLQEEKFALEDALERETGELPKAKMQRNFTDPESRIMKKGAGFEQCYNAQAAVDKTNQIIVAAYVTQACNDKQQLEPLVRGVIQNLGILPDRGLADAGFFSEAVAESLNLHYGATEWLISPGRLSHGSSAGASPKGRIPRNISTADLMRRKLSTKAGKAAYAQRKAIVEPAFGQIKEANLEFRRFSFRGFSRVQAEWMLVCAAHNILKIIRHRQALHKNLRQSTQIKRAA
jgi:transposase